MLSARVGPGLVGRGVLLGTLALAGAVVAVLAVLAIAVPVPGAGLPVRQLAELTRRLSGEWCGVPIASPYLPPPASGGRSAGEDAKMSSRQRRKWMMADPATSRDLLWMIVGPCAGGPWPAGPQPGPEPGNPTAPFRGPDSVLSSGSQA